MNTHLTQPMFDLLVALASGQQHGYALMNKIEEMHGGKYRPSPGVIYSNIQRCVDAGWIEEVAVAEDSDGRRRNYRLTRQGHEQALAYAQQSKQVADNALKELGRASC